MGEDSNRNNGGVNGEALVGTGDRLSPGVLRLDHVYEALSHPRRRYLCYSLLEDTEWSLTELATKIAAWEQDLANDEVAAHVRERIYVSLYHSHVPKLVDLGVVSFDETTETIRPAEHAEQVLAALEAVGASLDSKHETHARQGKGRCGGREE